MATNRTRIRRPGKKARITDEVIRAWKACDEDALRVALNLTPWNHSPLPEEITSLGVSQGEPPDWLVDVHHRADWFKAQKLQRELLNVAGWPNCRQVYRDNLAEASRWQRDCKSLVDNPEYGGQGTRCDPISRQEDLEEAKARVAYRRALLDGLDKKVASETTKILRGRN